MKIKNPNPVAFLDPTVDPLITLYFEVNHLKQLFRQGWLERGVSEAKCESVAEHCFGMAILAMFICDAYFPTLDKAKVVMMCLVHEFGEIGVGDVTPAHNIPVDLRHQQEFESIQKLLAPIAGSEKYLALWEEFEKAETPEAVLVKQLDRLEMGLQAKIYGLQTGKNLQEFIESARAKMIAPELQALLNNVEAIV
jgi:putative hydrolases of HD superfamily